MSNSVKIDLKTLDRFSEALRKGPDIVREEIVTATNIAGEFVRATAVKNVGKIQPYSPVDTGQMRASILVSDAVIRPTKIERYVSVGVKHGVVVEKGRKPGTFPPVKRMRQWVKRKGIAKGKQADAIAFLIGRKIKEKGIKKKPFLEPAIASSGARFRFVDALSKAVEKALARIGGK